MKPGDLPELKSLPFIDPKGRGGQCQLHHCALNRE